MEPAPVRRRARRSTHLRAVLVGGLGVLALAALGWALMHRDGEPQVPEPAAAPVAQIDVPDAPSTATLVEAAPASAPVANPFEGDVGSDDPSAEGQAVAAAVDAAAVVAIPPAPSRATVTGNPFGAMEATPERAAPKAPRPAGVPARASRPATGASAAPVPASAPAARAAPSRADATEAGLLQTLMDNIQQPSTPARDTTAMDRLARRLDRAPMPEPAPATGTIVAPQKQSLAAMLEQCPTSSSLQGQRCRRQMCERAGVSPRRCARH